MSKNIHLIDMLNTEDSIDSVLLTISNVGIQISKLLRNARLGSGVIGLTGEQNSTGDYTKILDLTANKMFIHNLQRNRDVFSIISEESSKEVVLNNDGKYIVTLDPLDGSSNIDLALPTGTIFSILDKTLGTLQSGENICASGYLLYGSSTIFVFTKGDRVDGYSLSLNSELELTLHDMKIPDGHEYHTNESYSLLFPKYVNNFLNDMKESKHISSSYQKCMVADMHKIFLRGGIYLYPESRERPSGKIRLVYEINPLAFLANVGRGKSLTGGDNPLKILPVKVHQQMPIVMGSSNLVDKYLEYWSAEKHNK